MMREILFRGKRVDNDEWVYGFLTCMNYIDVFTQKVCYDGEEELKYCTVEHCQVDAHTVGQYTGLTDKNGKMIFEGDICRVAYLGRRCDSNGRHYPFENVMIEEVVLEKGAFCFKTTIEYITIYRPIGFDIHGKPRTKYYEVIGDIHDNPELLEV